MRNFHLKMFALGLITTLAFTSCEVRNQRYVQRPDHHRRDRDHRDHDRRDDDRRGDDHRYNRY